MCLNSPDKSCECVAWHGADTGLEQWHVNSHEESGMQLPWMNHMGFQIWNRNFERVNILVMANSF